MSEAYEIANEEDRIVIRIDAGLVDPAALTKLLDYLELESARRRSRLTEEQAAGLSMEVDHSVWEQVRRRYKEE